MVFNTFLESPRKDHGRGVRVGQELCCPLLLRGRQEELEKAPAALQGLSPADLLAPDCKWVSERVLRGGGERITSRE